ncbi:MAG: MptD family putative ECF transporter S component [Prevotella sp.]|nr:MptD family putative ECF transporter S component [Prevotella sp.]
MKKKINYSGIVGFTVLYAASVFLTAFLGFLHPVLWVGLPVLAAFVGAFSYFKVADQLQCFGVGLLLSAVLAGFLLAIGEFDMHSAFMMLTAGVASDIVRQYVGNTTLKGVSWGYPVLALGVISWIHPLWARPQWYHDGAESELGADYADTLVQMSTMFHLCLVVVLTLVVGYIGIRLAAKWMKSSFEK